MRLLEREIEIVAELDLGLDVAQRNHLVAQRNPVAPVRSYVVVIAPFVDAHLLADDLDHRRGTIIDVGAGAQLVDGQRRIVPVRHRPDDVLGPERSIAAEEHLVMGRGHGPGIDLGHVPLVELDPDIALDPGERILLADGDQHVIARHMLVGLAGWNKAAPALCIVFGPDLLEHHAGETAALVGERLRHQEIEDRDVLVQGVLLLPGRRLHLVETGAHDHLDVLPAEPAGGPAAVHGGVAAAKHDDPAADLGDVPEGDRGQPIDSDMDVGSGFLAARDIEVTTARGARTDEDRVPVPGKQRFEALDACAAAKLDSQVEDIIAFLVDNGLRQAESGDLRADHAACLRILVEDDAMIAKRSKVARYGERRRSAAHERDAFAVLDGRGTRQAAADVVFEVGGDALETADRNRVLLNASAPAGRLAWPIARAPENAGKHIRLPIDHVGIAVAAGCDQSDIFGNRRVSRASPLTIHDLVEIVGRRNVGRFHLLLCAYAGFAFLFSPRHEPASAKSGAPAARAGAESGADTSGAPLGIPPIRSSYRRFTSLTFNNPCGASGQRHQLAPGSWWHANNMCNLLKNTSYFADC